MRPLLVKPASRLKGEITLLGDKSIAHRSIIISAITPDITTIDNFPNSKDCLYTIKAFRRLGIKITQKHANKHKGCSVVTVFGKGLYGLKEPKGPIFIGESGTTLRLILGVLAGQKFKVILKAGKSLSQRPMRRVNVPLRLMGARINAKRKTPACRTGRQNAKSEEYPPITIKGGVLKPITYRIPVASAQVKSAILLAGLYAKGTTQVIEPLKTRDHTERMLRLFGADLKLKQNTIVIKRNNKELVSPERIYVLGDISSASFFIVLAAILPDAQVLIRNVSLNPLRIGVIKVLERMGANIRIKNKKIPHLLKEAGKIKYSEPVGDLIVKNSLLKGTTIKKEEIPSLIDEIPILMVAACFANGRTFFEGVEELRVKETDRIRSMSENLKKMGANIEVFKISKSENIIVRGTKGLYGNQVRSFGDHRTAMSMVVAGLSAAGKTVIDDITCIKKSFPGFLHTLKTVTQ